MGYKTVAQLEATMSTRELMLHAAEYRLTGQEQAKARDKAKQQAHRRKGRL